MNFSKPSKLLCIYGLHVPMVSAPLFLFLCSVLYVYMIVHATCSTCCERARKLELRLVCTPATVFVLSLHATLHACGCGRSTSLFTQTVSTVTCVIEFDVVY